VIYWGALTLFISLLALLLGLTLGQSAGFGAPLPLTLFGVWGIFLALFISIERHTPEPMVDLRLFRNRLLTINLITGFLTFVAIAGAILLLPFYLEDLLGFDVLHEGFLKIKRPNH
jgi:ABC-type amino acid transport system permease subunit